MKVMKNKLFIMYVGDQSSSHAATPEEQRDYGLSEGEPVVEVRRVDGTVDLYVGRKTAFVVHQPVFYQYPAEPLETEETDS
jgi:hypothetical protein